MSSPTQRSLKYLREQGYTVDVVERWIPGANIRKDLFGFIDLLAIREDEVLGVQSTSGDNVAARVDKIANHDNLDAVRKAGIRILVHGWRKNAAGRWTLREVDCS
jgi:carbonic anhydrase